MLIGIMRRVLTDGTNIIIFVLYGLVRTRFWMGSIKVIVGG